MKKILLAIWGFYTFYFLIGYAAFHMSGKEKSQLACEAIMRQEVKHIWFVPVFAPGEGNACLDMGYYPLEARK